MRLLLLCCLPVAALACSAPHAAVSAPPAAPLQELEPVDLTTAAWQSMSMVDFEALLPRVVGQEVSQAQLQELAQEAAGEADPMLALRAILILAQLDRQPAWERLLLQLEARHAHPERPADAADVTAAAALARCRFGSELALADRLVALADGPEPHPDLEVRTECARTALLLGRDEVAGLLLRIVRLGTLLGRERDGDWHSTTTTTWSRNRAAEALAERLQVPCPYRGDASLADREAAARALETAWLATKKK